MSDDKKPAGEKPAGSMNAPKGEKFNMADLIEEAASSEEIPARAKGMRSHGRVAVRATLKPRNLMDAPVVADSWTAKIITLFPEMFPGVLGGSLTGKALNDGLWSLDTINPRDFATDKHRSVDAPPAGGGAGLVMKPQIIAAAIDKAQEEAPDDREAWPVIYMSPRGKPFDQAMARRFSRAKGITILCGRFEGVDERVLESRGVEEVSLGDFVLTGGEIPAMALIDATVRLIPRVLGNAESIEEESFSNGLLEHPQYTKPAVWEGHAIPEVLLSGHHANIAKWRSEQSERLTKERRPDLWEARVKARNGQPEEAELSDAKKLR